MPRRSSGGRSSRSAPRSPPPQPAPRAPPPAPVGGGSFGGAVAEGMAIGTGMAVAQRAVDAVVGPRTIRHESVGSAAEAAAAPAYGGSDACSIHTKAFQDCLNGYGSDISKCQFYMDLLAECRRTQVAR